MFKEAQVKELKNFFDHHVWVFEATKEADPTRTLTSRLWQPGARRKFAARIDRLA